MRELMEGVNLAAFAAGNRRLIRAVQVRAAAPGSKTATENAEAAEHPFVTWAKRLGGTAAVLLLLWPVIGKWVPTVTGASLALWVIIALIAGQPESTPKAAEQTTESTTDPAPTGSPQDADEWIQDSPPEAVLWALIRHTAALTKQGTAAHLQAVLDEARKRGEMTDWTVTDLAEELASYGVPVAEQKKLTIGGRQYNRIAVLLDALPEADPAPVPAIVQPAVQTAA